MNNDSVSSLRVILTWIVAALTLGYFCFLFYWQYYAGVQDDIWEVIVNHYAVFIGLPCAALASLLIVLVLEQAAGTPLEFSGLGFQFKGAAGQIAMWLACYVVIVLSIKLLW